MAIRCRPYSVALAASLACALLAPCVRAELADAAARLSYGYYTEEPAVVRAAFDALERMPDGPEVDYYRALAAMRLVELGVTGSDLLGRCVDIGEGLEASPRFAREAAVLVAACSSLAAREAPLKSILHHRRRDAALARVLGVQPDHPRALWVAAWSESLDAVLAGQPLGESDRMAVEAAVTAFRESEAGYDAPDWGQAEALAYLGAAWLAAGDARRGRDLLEEALLVAPGYRLALELMGQLKDSR